MEDLLVRVDICELGDMFNRDYIYVDQFDDDVWFKMNIGNASIHTVLTKDQAKELIAALQKVVQA